MQKEKFLKELRRILLLDESIEKEEVEFIINSTRYWIESDNLDVTDVEIRFDRFDLICLLEIVLYDILPNNILFCEKNTKISDDDIMVNKNSWIVLYDSKEKIFQIIFANN